MSAQPTIFESIDLEVFGNEENVHESLPESLLHADEAIGDLPFAQVVIRILKNDFCY